MTIPRYDLSESLQYSDDAGLRVCTAPDGEWVKWSDIAELFSQDDVTEVCEAACTIDSIMSDGPTEEGKGLRTIAAKIATLVTLENPQTRP